MQADKKDFIENAQDLEASGQKETSTRCRKKESRHGAQNKESIDMPSGKGTYGSKRGRPRKKSKGGKCKCK